jgi:hypothetical protein
LTIAAINVQAGDLALWYIAIPGAVMLIGLCVLLYLSLPLQFPDLKGGQGSLIYFAAVQKRTDLSSWQNTRQWMTMHIDGIFWGKFGEILRYSARNTPR